MRAAAVANIGPISHGNGVSSKTQILAAAQPSISENMVGSGTARETKDIGSVANESGLMPPQ
jgi:hypothetical protein